MNKKRWLAAALAVAVLAYAAIRAFGAWHGKSSADAEPKTPVANAQPANASVRMDAGAGKSGPVVRAAQTDRLAMDFNPQTAEITVTDLASGTAWSSNPADREQDSFAKGVKKQDLNAQLLLDYVDPQNKPFQLNNYSGSIKGGTYSWQQIENGLEVTFEFPQAGFAIPVRYSLKDDGFIAAIDTAHIVQRDKYSLVNVNLMPFFGAGGLQDDGYLFVPDGSGALMRFNNGKSIYQAYDERVYGRDQAVDKQDGREMAEPVRLPVFGVKKNDGAFVAVIHQGAYQSGIRASVSRKTNAYNAVSGYLNMKEFETNVLMEGSPNEKQVVRSSDSDAGNTPFEVRYYFLHGDKADYAGMADRYRQYLREDQGVKTSGSRPVDLPTPIMLELLGAIKIRDTALGVPYGTVETLTSFDDVREVADRLRKKGITKLSIRYEGWQAGGLKDEVPTSADAESSLGGNKSFRKLAAEMEERGIAFYPVVDPVNLYENGNGFNKFFDAAKNISRAPALQRSFLLGSGGRDPNIAPWYLLKPESVREAVDRYSASAQKKAIARTAYKGIGSMIYSDFRRGLLTKNETGRIWEESLQTAASRSKGLLFDHANAYAFPSAEALADVPLYSSGFDMEDESVPFYSIAVSGLIPAYGEPINLSSNTRDYLLKLIETGTFPAYRFIARDGSLLVGTDQDSLYSGDFDRWFDDVVAQYEELDPILQPIAGQPIVHHDKLGEGVYRTEYANGKTVTVNYSNSAVTIDNEPIEPHDYRIS